MPDDNRFAGLSDVVGEDDEPADSESEGDERENEPEADQEEPSTTGDLSTDDDATREQQPSPGDKGDSEPSADSNDQSTGSATVPTDDSAGEDSRGDETSGDEPSAQTAGGPAFEFDQTTAKSIYVRPSTLDLLEDTEFEVEMQLRTDHGVRDVTGREFHDAAIHVLEQHVEEVVARILEARNDD